MMFRSPLALVLLLLAPVAQAADCGRLLVSGYGSTVHVYDGCSGAYLQDLGSTVELGGPQALRRHGDLLYVVAETRGRVLRFDAATLQAAGSLLELGAGAGITGLAFGPDGDAYVGAYNEHTVYRFDAAGAPKGAVFAPGAAGLAGPDNGLLFGPDGQLYVPGYDSHNVVRWNPATGAVSEFIPPRRGGLRNTRGLLFERDGGGLLVTSEGSNAILRFRLDGSFDRVFTALPFRPTGIDYGADGDLLVTGYQADRVVRVDPLTGALGAELVPAHSGGLVGATFLLHVAAAPAQAIDAAQVSSQYWLTGAGEVGSRTLRIDDLQSAGGTAFGGAFDPAAVVRRRWGRLEVEFTGCDAGVLRWESTGTESAGFGSGGYPIQRVAPTRASQACNAAGFAAASGIDWVAGSWYGGPARDGEGLFLDVLANEVVVAAFFTHRPVGLTR